MNNNVWYEWGAGWTRNNRNEETTELTLACVQLSTKIVFLVFETSEKMEKVTIWTNIHRYFMFIGLWVTMTV